MRACWMRVSPCSPCSMLGWRNRIQCRRWLPTKSLWFWVAISLPGTLLMLGLTFARFWGPFTRGRSCRVLHYCCCWSKPVEARSAWPRVRSPLPMRGHWRSYHDSGFLESFPRCFNCFMWLRLPTFITAWWLQGSIWFGLAASPSLRMLCFTWLSPVSFWNALPLPHMTVRPRWPRSILQSHWVSPYTDWAYIWSCVVLPTVLLMVGSFLAWWWFASSATTAYVEQHLCGPTVFSRGPACLCTLCLWLRHAARSTQVYDFGWAWTKRYQCTEVGAHIASPEPCHSGSVAF